MKIALSLCQQKGCKIMREVLRGCGWLVPVKSPEALARAMSEAARLDVPKCMQCDRAARQRVEARFSLNTIAMQWLKLYQAG